MMAGGQHDHAANALMKRGKRPLAVYMKAQCLRIVGKNNCQQLHDLLDHLLDPREPFDYERIDWCRWLIAGGATFDDFAKTVRMYDNAVTCGLVWTANFVAYRCRTCGISPCMSLCAECFQASDHQGHDFNMFRSQAGGACDCGDVSVMNPDGFCPRHGPNRTSQQHSVPPDLLVIAEEMMPRLLWRFIQHLRGNSKPEMLDTFLVAMEDADQYLTFLHTLSDMGAAMRHVFTSAMTNTQVYKNFNESRRGQTSTHNASPSSSTADVDFDEELQINYETAIESLRFPPMPEELPELARQQSKLVHTNLLEELVFWMVKFEFPQKIVTLLLSILPDDAYKEAFTRTFVQHYSRISIALVNSIDRQTISNRVVHISVQLFSNESIASKIAEQYQLIHVMIASLNHMLKNILTESTLQVAECNLHMVVDCSKDILRDHCYWPVVSDLINLLSHSSIANQIFDDLKMMPMWLELISYFQGMNLNVRELSQHVEYEPDTYYAAFSAELEICASPMWSLLVHLKNKGDEERCKRIIKMIVSALQHWFNVIDVNSNTVPNSRQISFHLPLHRYLAAFLSQAVCVLDIPLSDVLPSSDQLKQLLIHPLQIQVAFYEIFCGLWVRNGLQIKGQAMTYIQCHFCNSLVDADIFLLQVCAAYLDPEFVLKSIFERFHVFDWVTLSPIPTLSPRLQHEDALLEGCLTFLATLLGFRNHWGIGEEELTRIEMVTLLCVSDRTHSQLMDLMPEKCGLSGQTKQFEPILRQIGDYKAPNFEAGGGTMQQGMYVPKELVWNEDFDPMYVSLRAVHRRDFQSAMDRYTTAMRQSGKYSGKGSPWPPFRLPRKPPAALAGLNNILNSRNLHSVLFTILYKALTQSHIPEGVLYLAIYLLEIAVKNAPPTANDGTTTPSSLSTDVKDRVLSDWFPSDSIIRNIGHTIESVSTLVMKTGLTDSQQQTDLQQAPSTQNEFTQTDSASASTSTAVTAAMGATGAIVLPTLPQDGPHSTALFVGIPTPLSDYNALSIIQQVIDNADDEQTDFEPSRAAMRRLLARSFNNRQVRIDESILSLLVKLHAKLSDRGSAYAVDRGRLPSSSRVGDGEFFIGNLLDSIVQTDNRLAEQVDAICKSLMPTGGESPKMEDQEERRRKARERQRKLMAEMASKQKAFLAAAMETEGPDGVSGDMDAMDADSQLEPDSSLARFENTYDCVICSQTTPSTEERPLGLVTLAQSTSVLGHRRQTPDAQVLPVNDKMTTSFYSATCRAINDNWRKMLKSYFEERFALLSVNMGWEGGVSVQTCGHYIHLDCYRSYMQSLVSDEHLLHMNQMLAVDKGEYRCPVCRKLANTIIPVAPDTRHCAMSKQIPTDSTALVRELAQLLDKRPFTPGHNSLTAAMGKAMEDINNATYQKYKNYSTTNLPEGVQLFVHSVARSNLELELLNCGGRLGLQQEQTHRSALVPLIQVLSMHSKILTTKPHSDLWAQITGVCCHVEEQTSSVQVYQKEVPLLLKDVTALLVQLHLALPPLVEKEYFQCIVKVLYNVLYVKALAVMSCKFTEEERDAWRRKVQQVSTQTLEGLLNLVIGQFVLSQLYSDVEMNQDTPAICQTVWSPHSVESSVQDYCLPFVRIASLLMHHVYDEALPDIQNSDCEFALLCNYLGLGTTTPGSDPRQFQSAAAITWFTDKPRSLIRTWCIEFTNFVAKNEMVARNLLLVNPVFYPPRLYALPNEYDAIFQYYRRKTCSTCLQQPKEPALCLVCGQLLCFKESCCKSQGMYECVQHSINCGAGTGLYLVVNSSVVVLIRGDRATLWGSVYLDEYGEEDKDLKRGKPLYLSDDRYKLLQQQWINHSFDHTCKKWIWHQDRL
ncbi:E3 ubiquitin-protein ligase UBR3-like [Tubulanus polymorphus]|uniref:E3 ubiquitin-protein ligase UBR3-like n=1 Tax=Tubulanus polymorphus TaxID=672921 RepID=UPI003DA61FB3